MGNITFQNIFNKSYSGTEKATSQKGIEALF